MNHGTIYAYKDRGCRCEECRAMWAKYNREYRAENGERISQRRKERRAERLETGDHPHSKEGYRLGCRCDVCILDARSSRTKRVYGFDATAVEQKCQICGATNVMLHVDHDHVTQKTRGLICAGCNNGLACLGDNVEGVRKAIEYLTK